MDETPMSNNDQASSISDRKSTQSACPKIPVWFLEHCLQTPLGLEVRGIPLEILPPEPRDTPIGDSGPRDSETFQIDEVIYKRLHCVLWDPTRPGSNTPFRHDAIYLHMPGMESGQKGCDTFLQAVVERFAKDIGANLVTLTSEDLRDLAGDIRTEDSGIVEEDPMKYYFGRHRTTEESLQRTFPFATIFQMASKGATSTGNTHGETPVILHLPELDKYKYGMWGNWEPENVVDDIKRAISQQGPGILLVQSSKSPAPSVITRTHPPKRHVTLIPVNSKDQIRLLRDGLGGPRILEQKNIRALQKSLRRLHGEEMNSELLQPNFQPEFPADSKTAEMFRKKLLELDQIYQVAQQMPRDAHLSDLERITREAVQVESLLTEFNQQQKGEESDQKLVGHSTEDSAKRTDQECTEHSTKEAAEQTKTKRPTFSDKTKKIIREIKDQVYGGGWGSFGDQGGEVCSVDETWDDIEIDSDTKSNIIQLIDQLSIPGHEQRGILKKSRIKGALLYGPPGTGKTLLARVLAKECEAVMISVTSADISDKYVGETQKTIKSLFNLGRLLFPSVLFFDEADSLFRGRTSGDHTWERDQVNQLLSEMDGLKTSKTPPFVLLATNFPQALDHAVLRRVPSRLYIGLPSLTARKRLFEICLREDELGSDVDFEKFANDTKGYSGSDIMTVCVQAALIRDEDNAAPLREGNKLLMRAHIHAAITTRVSSTVPKRSLLQIQDFAKEHDRPAFSKMRLGDADSSNSRDFNRFNNVTIPTEAAQSLRESNVANPNDFSTADSSPPNPGEEPRYNIGFQYPKLDQSGRQIRVLEIEVPLDVEYSHNSDIIRCKLETVDLSASSTMYKSFLREIGQLNLDLPYYDHDITWMLWYLKNNPPLEGEIPELDKDFRGTLADFIKRPGVRLNQSWDIPFEMACFAPRFLWGDYMALSYVWGNPEEREDIYIDGQKFSVTRNLFLALKRLRNSHEIREMHLKVWVDAICINQNNLTERAAEVKRMGFIYSEAIAVRGWIGECPGIVADHNRIVRKWLDQIDDNNPFPLKVVPGPEVSQALRSLGEVLSKEDYWLRVWIVQEMFLAVSLRFWYGDCCFDNREMLALVSEGFAIQDDRLPLSSNLSLVRGINPIYARISFSRVALSKRLSLLNILHISQCSKATDERDKVYGILALVTNEISSLIQPSYDQGDDVNTLYTSFTKSCILYEDSLNTLARMRPAYLLSRGSLPTWALDLSYDRENTTMPFEFSRYKTNDGTHELTAFSGNNHINFSDDDRIMLCEGVIVDAIETLSSTFLWSSNATTVPMDPEPDSEASDTDPSNESKLALARILCHDFDYEFSQGPSLLDVPWGFGQEADPLEANGSESTSVSGSSHPKKANATQRWGELKDISLNIPFHDLVYANANYPIHGVALRNYFNSREEFCPDPAAYSKLARTLLLILHNRRLCTTRNRRLGMVPHHAKRGDKIAVMYKCDMPIILRPTGEATGGLQGSSPNYDPGSRVLPRKNPANKWMAKINPDALLDAARLDKERASGRIRGPLHGIPYVVKDNIATNDKMQTTAGSWVLMGSRVPRDAFVVSRLREAGAVLLGKSALTEWAHMRSSNMSEGYSARGGQVRSPYNFTVSPGGSSSGSAVAVASNQCMFSVGTETDGSVVIPAERNALVGIKPTVGLTSRSGVIPETRHMDTVGVFGRSVKDAALALDGIYGIDSRDRFTSQQRGKTPRKGFARFITNKGALKDARFGIPWASFWARNSPEQNLELLEIVQLLVHEGATVVNGTELEDREILVNPHGWDWDWRGKLGFPNESHYSGKLKASLFALYSLRKEN
ncbi:hypothetical protein O1611_g2647 [Lasiodiplodia mahajangana]|uniref:Uncharacterized protein n=1 Tax=Lasiodiplodia mahajangana TaxID=1108764 RepID=A0ACC2JU41_9PEZI|nr:hypothetical protein O1611_g2647 [Lasiodiplodia mahajangana]